MFCYSENQFCKTSRRKMHKTARRHLVHPVLPEYFLNTLCLLWLCSELSTVDSIMLRTSKGGVVVLVLKS